MLLIRGVCCSNISADDMLYTETDLEESMEKIETINFHEVKEVAGIKFWCYHAGHVLGAAMFMIEIAGVKVCPDQRVLIHQVLLTSLFL